MEKLGPVRSVSTARKNQGAPDLSAGYVDEAATLGFFAVSRNPQVLNRVVHKMLDSTNDDLHAKDKAEVRKSIARAVRVARNGNFGTAGACLNLAQLTICGGGGPGSSDAPLRGEPGGRDWNVRMLLCGDGSIGKIGYRVDDGEFYAAASLRGRHESFHHVSMDSVQVCSQGATVLQWPVLPVTDNAIKRGKYIDGPSADVTGLDDKEAKFVLLRVLVRWCEENRGYAAMIGGPGFRAPSERLNAFLVKEHSRLRDTAPLGRCVYGCIVFAIDRLFGIEAGDCAYDELMSRRDRTGITNLGPVREHLHALPFKVTTKKVKDPDAKSMLRKRRCEAFQWFVQKAKGVWIVRLVESGVVDHCVLVDCDASLIFDVAEEYPLPLREEVLRYCGGDDAENVSYAECRQIVKQEH